VLSGSPDALVDVLAPRGDSETSGLTDRLFVPLPSPDGDPLGVLVLLANEPRAFLLEEIELAGAFASFAGTALRNLDQLELERRLVAELQESLELRRDLVASVSHELRTPLTCITGFSSHLLQRTLVNLLANAVKYSDAGSPVDVRTSSAGGLIRVEVVDRGVGLSADEAYRVFDPFWRAHRGDRGRRGTGIGLALVRDYV